MRTPESIVGRLQRAETALPEPERRRAHLLAWLLLGMLALSVAALVLMLIFNPATDPRHNEYLLLIGVVIVLVGIAYGLNWTGHYNQSAGLFVVLAAVGPWGAVVLDSAVVSADFVAFTYVVLPLLLSSLLLRPRVTIALSLLELVVLASMPTLIPATAPINWPGFLGFVATTAALSVVSSVVTHRDMAQLDRQTHQLARSEATMRELSIRDPLTGLFNRRYMEETLEREVTRAARVGSSLGVIMMDIDHFKRFNDRLGHAAGDVLLQELGVELARQVRSDDVACRYGGEEFVLLMPDSSLEVTALRAERVRDAVKRIQAEHHGRAVGPITISLGVAVFPDHGSDGDEVLESADSALYNAKCEGRDRVFTAEQTSTCREAEANDDAFQA